MNNDEKDLAITIEEIRRKVYGPPWKIKVYQAMIGMCFTLSFIISFEYMLSNFPTIGSLTAIFAAIIGALAAMCLSATALPHIPRFGIYGTALAVVLSLLFFLLALPYYVYYFFLILTLVAFFVIAWKEISEGLRLI